ncbi:hypothetical protein FJT64_014285 [Amphibalanus amphitrite]|uniref:CCHC-type domain-containing protein n=1 Tax=Amphibalanus amphitrite TaxID=1232801 RepID=A0A6A4V0T7_AMPAM|nr:hypothetical protein FJT64_014285 [Amphibalanus amphitrite]
MGRELLFLANFENFTGKDGQSWGEWYRRFRAKTIAFSEEDRLQGLVSLLQDGALDYFALLSEEVQSNLQQTVAALEVRFGAAKKAIQAHAELANIRQQPGEATRDFADRVRQVGLEAYPGARAGDPAVEATVVSRFVCGLREEELQTRVLRKDPSSLTEAMRIADKFQQQQDALRAMRPPIGGEALAVRDQDAPDTARLDALERVIGELQRTLHRIETMERRDAYRTGHGTGARNPQRGPRKANRRGNGRRCFRCNSPDHLIRDCPARHAQANEQAGRSFPRAHQQAGLEWAERPRGPSEEAGGWTPFCPGCSRGGQRWAGRPPAPATTAVGMPASPTMGGPTAHAGHWQRGDAPAAGCDREWQWRVADPPALYGTPTEGQPTHSGGSSAARQWGGCPHTCGHGNADASTRQTPEATPSIVCAVLTEPAGSEAPPTHRPPLDEIGHRERSRAPNTGLAGRCAQACARAVALVKCTARAVCKSAGFDRWRLRPTPVAPSRLPVEPHESKTGRCGGGSPSSGCVEGEVTSNGSETESASRCKGGSPSIDIAGQPDRQTAQASGEVNSADEVAGREVRAVSRPGVDGEAGDTSPAEQSNRQRAKNESPPRIHAQQCVSQETPFDASMPEECGRTEARYAQVVDDLVGIATASGRRVVVPPSRRTRVMQWAHESPTSGHTDHRRTTLRVKRNFVWPGMYKYIRDLCRTCAFCQRRDKPATSPKAPTRTRPVTQPSERVAGDKVKPRTAVWCARHPVGPPTPCRARYGRLSHPPAQYQVGGS